ncbi:cation:proton antiporter [Chitinimonas koreensis]|uniref:cation:proton antiporter n=1 Tax=Chitinimonas koreensis TaxID=356302 RepID=UPI00042486BB|nr:cation:proton antiporter [Chitinimonas koreensis]QNM97389.1 cation:proton antiporter [Chitinimonas koreensis]
MRISRRNCLLGCGLAAASLPAWAGDTAAGEHFLWLMMLLLLARLASLVERIGQPAVLGELAIGIVLGNLALAGFGGLAPLKGDAILHFLAELGVVVLLFQIGLESELSAMRQVGLRAFLVAVVGVVLPFLLGTWLVGPLLLPAAPFVAHLFLGAALTATSVGITGRVFQDAGQLHSAEARIVLGAAVIDDVLGLIILAVVSAIAQTGSVGLAEVAIISAKSLAFLLGAVLLGQAVAPRLARRMARIHPGPAMQFTVLISFCLGFAYLAHQVGLAPIVGAFAAGLILESAYMRDFRRDDLHVTLGEALIPAEPALRAELERVLEHENRHRMQRLVEPVGFLLVPLFFVLTGMQVDLVSFADPHTVAIALAVTVVAVLGKIAAGLAAGPVDKWLVGWGMVPRGEVGLIFAAIGRQIGVVSAELYSVIVVVIVLTTLVTPPVLAWLLRRRGLAS